MKKWIEIGILAVLVIGMVLMSGCTQDYSQYCAEKYPGTIYNPSTNLCDHVLDPIIGEWRHYNPPDFDFRYKFNADGTYVNSYFVEKETEFGSGTWIAQTRTVYVFHKSDGRTRTFVYEPARDVIYDPAAPTIFYNRYLGGERTAPSTPASPITNPTNTVPISTQSPTKPSTRESAVDPNTVLTAGQYQLSNMHYYIEGSYGYLSGTVKNTGTTYTDFLGFTGTLYDANDAVLVQGIDVTYGLAPGETGKFRITFMGPGARMPFTRYFIKVEGYNLR
jgi:hypothetical protein